MPKSNSATVALLRVSTDEQSSDSQRQEIEQWSSAKGIEIGRWYLEDGVSGAAKSRPVLDDLLRDAVRGRFSRVVVFELSRLGRSLPRIAASIEALSESGVKLVSIKEGIDTGTAMGKAMGYMAGVFAELERDRIRGRVKAGMAAAKRRGVQVGRPRLDWRPEEVGELRDLVAAGHSLRKIEREGLIQVFDARSEVPRTPSARAMARVLAAPE